MMLFEKMMEDVVLMTKTITPDGAGGNRTEWKEGSSFMCAITTVSSLEQALMEGKSPKSDYLLTTHADVVLDYHDVIKRVRDGAIFRVTNRAGDTVSPSFSNINISQVKAERWELAS